MSNPKKPHTWEVVQISMDISVDNIHIFMQEIFKKPYMYVFLLHINRMIFKRGIKVFLVFSHLCNHTLLGNTFYMHVNISKSPLIVGEWVKLESV